MILCPKVVSVCESCVCEIDIFKRGGAHHVWDISINKKVTSLVSSFKKLKREKKKKKKTFLLK